jgi:hypothetical protein
MKDDKQQTTENQNSAATIEKNITIDRPSVGSLIQERFDAFMSFKKPISYGALVGGAIATAMLLTGTCLFGSAILTVVAGLAAGAVIGGLGKAASNCIESTANDLNSVIRRF